LRLREREQSSAERRNGKKKRRKEKERREEREDRINKNKKFIHIATVNMYFYMLL
jgi:hypothetical protein